MFAQSRTGGMPASGVSTPVALESALAWRRGEPAARSAGRQAQAAAAMSMAPTMPANGRIIDRPEVARLRCCVLQGVQPAASLRALHSVFGIGMTDGTDPLVTSGGIVASRP